MLKLSAAFDTVDHSIVIERLDQSQGMDEAITAWCESYLRVQTQRFPDENQERRTARKAAQRFCVFLSWLCS